MVVSSDRRVVRRVEALPVVVPVLDVRIATVRC